MLIIAIALVVVAVPTASGTKQSFPAVPPLDPHAEVVMPGGADNSVDDARDGSLRSARGELLDLLRKGGKGGGQLLTGFGDFLFTIDNDSVRRTVMDETAGMHGSVVRLFVNWRAIAPPSLSPAFDPTDPAAAEYTWGPIDSAVRDAGERGLSPLLMITSAPDWAEGENRASDAPAGTWKPNPEDVADFGKAIAKRYSGSFQGLPKVRDYMLWNEPNLPSNLTPQWNRSGTKPVVASHYRDMLNAFYETVHGVDPSNRVITGGTAPYGSPPGPDAVQVSPLLFWREVMCVSDGKRPRATDCPQEPKFDVLAHHPIDTSGGPTTSAVSPDDVSTPDLHNLVDVLRAAERGHNIGTGGKHPVWATEVWWESNPPDKAKGIPSLATQARWYEEALYLLWKQGASTVLFYQVRDDPYHLPAGRGLGSSFDTGVYFSDDQPKPSSQAVRFPFVAQRNSKTKVTLWGIAPESGTLTVDQTGKGAKQVAKINVEAGRIFTKRVSLGGRLELRAQVAGEKSLKYSVR